MAKTPYVFPIVGGRKVSHLKGNIEALGLELSPEEIEEIEDASHFDVGFPMNMAFELFGGKYNINNSTKDVGLIKSNVLLDTVPRQQVSTTLSSLSS